MFKPSGRVPERTKRADCKSVSDPFSRCSQAESQQSLTDANGEICNSVLAHRLVALHEKLPEFSGIIESWLLLPEVVKTGIVAMVKALISCSVAAVKRE